MVTRRYKKIIAKAKYHSWDSLEFRDKWGTPDVIGKREPRRSDIVKASTEIVLVEIKAVTREGLFI